jgi:hypothetical protein
MKFLSSILLLSGLLLVTEPLLEGSAIKDLSSKQLLTQYHTRKTIHEAAPDEEHYEQIATSFLSNHYGDFISQLEMLAKESSFSEAPSTSLPVEKIEFTLRKFHAAIESFTKKYPSDEISHLLKEWASFHFTSSEKDTFLYFHELKDTPPDQKLTFLEHHLLSIVSHQDLLHSTFNQHKEEFSSFYQYYGDYLIDLNTHQNMLKLLDHDFEPFIYHHIETYLQIAKKKAFFLHLTHLLHQMTQGTIALTTQADIDAKHLLKPYLKKIESYCEPVD